MRAAAAVPSEGQTSRLGRQGAGLLLLLFGAGLVNACTCGAPCENDRCPQGQACSQSWDQCLAIDRVYGPACFSPADCHRGICLSDPSGTASCTGTCAPTDPPCPAGWGCVPVNDGSDTPLRVCAPAGEGEIGSACTLGSDCQSALCLPLGDGQLCSAFCDATDPASCPPDNGGNVGCVGFADSAGNSFDLCVAGGTVPPGQPCPGGVTDCDLSRSATCLQEQAGTTFCAPACTGADDSCDETPGGCCVDLGSGGPNASFCLTPAYCGCAPSCVGQSCGDDGCGGSCGSCAATEVCSAGACIVCSPSCNGAVCGDDGCGGVCGECTTGERCVQGACEATCTPSCASAVCGDDGCGGSCGSCQQPQRCYAGACVQPALLLVDLLVTEPGAIPPARWGLGEYSSAPSIGPPVVYGGGPQPGSTQELLCGNTVVCAPAGPLGVETAYGLQLGYDLGAGRVRCNAGFTLHSVGPPSVDGGDCVVAGGGPFASVELGGTVAAPSFSWTLP